MKLMCWSCKCEMEFFSARICSIHDILISLRKVALYYDNSDFATQNRFVANPRIRVSWILKWISQLLLANLNEWTFNLCTETDELVVCSLCTFIRCLITCWYYIIQLMLIPCSEWYCRLVYYQHKIYNYYYRQFEVSTVTLS